MAMGLFRQQLSNRRTNCDENEGKSKVLEEKWECNTNVSLYRLERMGIIPFSTVSCDFN